MVSFANISMAVHGRRSKELTLCLLRHGIRSLRLSAHFAIAGVARFLDIQKFHDWLGGCGYGCGDDPLRPDLPSYMTGADAGETAGVETKMPSNDVLLCADSRRVGTVKTMESAWLGHGCASAALVYRLLLCQVIIMDLSSSSLHFIVIVSVMLVASGCLHILMSIVSCVCGDSIELQ